MPFTPPILERPVRPLRRRAGSVILLVLVLVMLVSFLLTKFVQRAGTELLADARAGDQARLRREAYSALEVTLATLADIRGIDAGLQSPAQGWDRPLDYAGYTPGEGCSVEIKVEDESGKLSLPRLNATQVAALLELLGLSPAEAEKTSDALLVWTRADYLPASLESDGSSYQHATLPHNPAQRPLRSFGELAAVEQVRDYFFDENGRQTPLAREFAANVSLYSFDRTNLNTAPPVVLATEGLTAAQIDALATSLRQQVKSGGPGYFRAMKEVAPLLGANAPVQNLGVAVAALRLSVTVRSGSAAYQLSAVIAPMDGASLAEAPAAAGGAQTAPATGVARKETGVSKKLDYPFKVLEIREDVEASTTPPAETN